MSATAVPIAVVPSNSVTVVPFSAVPVKVGVWFLVMLSVLELPVSEASVMSGADGAAGGVTSMVTDSAADGAETTLLAMSVAVAGIAWTPLVSALTVTKYLPCGSAMSLPTGLPSERMVTFTPGSAVPMNVGVLSLVMLSVLELPVSDAGSRSGMLGGAGGKVRLVEATTPAS